MCDTWENEGGAVSGVSYTLPVDGDCKESLLLHCEMKFWGNKNPKDYWNYCYEEKCKCKEKEDELKGL